jgi:ubiquinone/menaquinone biosynthesis C-methylase UbiE
MMKDYLEHTFSSEDVELVSIIDELPLWSAPFGLQLLDTVELKPHINALDVGCGLGFPLIELAQRLGVSSKVYGIDPWKRALERAHVKIGKLEINNAAAVMGMAEGLPFQDSFFDLIVSNNGINNVEDIESSLAECYRVSKPGAQFVLTLNLEASMIEFYDVFQEILIKNGLHDGVSKMKDQIYSKRKPIDETKAWLDKAGFGIKNIEESSFQLRFTDGETMSNHYLIKYWFLDDWKSILEANDLAGIFEQLEERLNQLAKMKGEIRLTIPFVTIDCRRR